VRGTKGSCDDTIAVMTMSSFHILFRFHQSFDVCVQNVKLLRQMNPGVSIHGLYGGAGGVESLAENLTALFNSVYALPFEDPQYNWQHGDICIRWWYKERGNLFDFKHLCVVEWDMLFLRPLAEIYGGFAQAANYVAISGDYKKLLDEGWPWFQGRMQKAFDKLCELISKEKQINVKALSFGIFGGVVLSRDFLNHFSQKPVPSYCNDEVRLSLYSALYDIPLIDCGFLTDKRNKVNDEERSFTKPDILVTLARGGKVIHPVRSIETEIEKALIFPPSSL
jgi:hypothetical protein